MHDPRTHNLVADALTGRITRRQSLSLGLRLGVASPIIMALIAANPGNSRASSPQTAPARPSAAQEGSGALAVIISSGFSDLDPHYAYDNSSSMFFLATYEMLLQLKGESTDEFAPMLAESWDVSDDQSTYTFHIAPNALFHDGTPCDAEAVKASFTRFLLQGGGPVNVISRFVQDPEQMEVVDATAIRFNLGRPQPLFLAAMASEYGPFVVNPKAVEANKTDEDPFAHQWLQENTAGSGPYRVKEYIPNDGAVLERFADYHKGWDGSQFDQILIRVVPENATRRQLIENGDADALTFTLTPEDVTALQGNPDLQVLIYDTTNVTWVTMNAPRLMTREVRQGFSYAFPYEQVVDGAYKGLLTRTSGPIPTAVRGYDPEGFVYQTDLAKARELILSGGFVEGDSFEYMLESADEVEAVVAQLFQANVAEMGFQLELIEVDGATLNQVTYGDAPAEERPHFFGGWSWWPDYNDPWNQLAPNFLASSTGEGGANAGYWVNERFEEIMAEAEHYTNEQQLVALMKEAQNILTAQDPPAIYYGQLQWYTILRKGIQGYHHNPLYLGSYPFYEMSRAPTG